ncbi:MAG TPA: diacylglycerol kinase family protein [Methyloceanibacter sp.]|nr:diacylglycerol kinase family protein [Methyloceanibacter sp.]
MRALLLHNPTAGSGRHTREELVGLLDASGFSTRYVSTDDDAYKDILAESDAEILIIAGGDGTVGKVARHIPNRKVPVTILPTGTANNVARNLAIVGEMQDLIPRLRDASERRLDVGCASGSWGDWNFLESVGWGALAKVVDTGVEEDRGEEKILRGRELFAEILEAAQPSHVCCEADGHAIEGDFIFVEILNIGMTGPRVTISPSAEPGDGLLDIVFLPAARKQEMIDWLRSDPDETPIPLTEIKAKVATLHWREGPLRIDDEVFDAPEQDTDVRVEIEPHGFHVRVPVIED